MAVLLTLGLLGLTPSANAVPSPELIANSPYPVGIAEDSFGNVWIADGDNADSALRGLVVVPAADGDLFGISVTAGVQVTLVPQANLDGQARGVAVDSQNAVYVSDNAGSVWVLTSTDRLVFGISVTANTLTRIANGTGLRGGLEFDSAGNLFGVRQGSNTLSVLPVGTGSLFGVSVTANTAATILTHTGGWFWDLAIDGNDNVFITDGWGLEGVFVLPKATSTLYGQVVDQDIFTELNVWANVAPIPPRIDIRPAGIDIDGSGNMFVAFWRDNVIAMVAPTATTYFGQSVPALTATRLTYTSGYANQGVAIGSAGSLISGGGQTYRLPNFTSYTVTFDANALDVTGTMASQTNSSAAALNPNDFTRDGYTFAGWATTPTGPIAYSDGATYAFTANVTLYARWAAPGEDIPILVRVLPADVHQSVSIPSDGDCSDVDGPGHNWAGTTNGGWGKSWAQWPNGGTGGFVCNRVLRYSAESERWYTVV